ncbi:50S ribosomal protein L21 [Candidatus Amesbacteria bacterium RIFCSPLOWO2_02_FULL_48_11]|uniref:Large ribosomal subunit protein bL21 n=5 Tax=Candidatus Amesiibacteriota TaxID=1752730 RepID=A0A1F4Z856_9BACT|nr:MAG: 50S ribosomal protein L21 [Candidatus Amesbacteria bacterium GW2011_GWA2_47_11]KKU95029.1 MAG: 50S ribosomal protein L21 [Candidatus Amesbacteria bacterium GW2011_GWC1_48_10]KKW00693.1 MAG: 50S ribosomal protein L21 [Candidatus Amesbacteria bacterium GW2011_GWA1_48_9]OGC90313.1 MAG: 50S ribosomal protein L21 [Candidatus Amesbacteria bacterium RBG_19FT_COMBO_48_16]OGC96360.1 MAG: 50S ribosomal protein L21 [Candidatus Amesbacteria bacterium RIFCSPHIGHO2_02_FULL_48_21]OGC98593.1 MAG: 50S 
MNAVVKIGTSQYLVSPGMQILVNTVNSQPGSTLTFDQVLLISDGDNILIGQPYIDQAKVTASIIAETKGKKIRVSTYKAKSRYRRVKGFRPRFIKIRIDNISINNTPKPRSRTKIAKPS